MQDILIARLYEYIKSNNRDLLIALSQTSTVTAYLEEKVATVEELMESLTGEGTPAYIIEERCMAVLTEELRPSRYNYIREILEEDFEDRYDRLTAIGILDFEIINMIAACMPVFDNLGFSEENEEDRHLRLAITGTISEYLERVKM